MVDVANLRSRTPGPSPTPAQVSRRADSVPPIASKKRLLLECVLMGASLKRKRGAVEHSSSPLSQAGPSTPKRVYRRASQPGLAQDTEEISASSRVTRASMAAKKSAPIARLSRKGARTSSVALRSSPEPGPSIPRLLREGRTGLLTPAPSQTINHARPNTPAQQENVESTRASTSGANHIGKGKAREQIPTPATSEPLASASPPPSDNERAAKHRRVSISPSGSASDRQPSPGPSSLTPDIILQDLEVEEDTPYEFDFEFLDVSEVAVLPWGSTNDSIYVPPALGSLIDNMKHALATESVARRSLEERYAAEVRRRVEAERSVSHLKRVNKQLDDERRAFTKAAVDVLSSTLAPATSQSKSAKPRSRRPVPTPAVASLTENEGAAPEKSSESVVADEAERSGGVVDPQLESPSSTCPQTQSASLTHAAAVKELFDKFLPLPTLLPGTEYSDP